MTFEEINERVRDAWTGFDRELDNLWEELDTNDKGMLLQIWDEHNALSMRLLEEARERLTQLQARDLYSEKG